jgi:DNA-directed RNA polymerase subunit RPC12/RpoP
MSTITFQCAACEGDFELKIAHLVERPNALKCPHCGNKPSQHRAHAFAQGLDDLLSAMNGLKAKFHFELSLDNEELPAPYGATVEDVDDAGLGSLSGADDDDDEEEDEDDEDFEEEDEFEDFDDDDDFDDEDDDDDDDEDEREY